MANPLYGTSGTLVGAPVAVDFQVAAGFVAGYVEVHNLDPVQEYTCTVNGATLRVPQGRALQLPGLIPNLTIDGTGPYQILASQATNPNATIQLPHLMSTSQAGSGVSISPPDNVTLQDTGTVLQIKDLGVSTAKLADTAVATGKLADLAVTTGKLADLSVTYDKVLQGAQALLGIPDAANIIFTGNPVDGDTCRIVYGASDVTYTFRAAAGGFPEVQIGGASTDTATNLVAAITASQITLIAVDEIGSTQPVVGAIGADPVDIQNGETFAITIVSANMTSFAMPTSSAELKTGCMAQSFTVDATLTAADAVFVPFGFNIIAWIVAVRDNTFAQKYWTGMSSTTLGNTGILIVDGGATPWTIGDVFTIIAFGST